MGSLWAFKLASSGCPVTLIVRQKASEKLTLRYRDETGQQAQPQDQSAKESAHQSIILKTPTQVSHLRVLLVCVKTYQLEAALESISHAISPNTQVVLLQNGMGNREAAEAILPPCQLLLATTTHGAYISERATNGEQLSLIHAGRGTTAIGPAHPQQSMLNAPQLCQLLQRALPDVIWHYRIDRLLWQKLMINAAINPLTALYQCRNGELLDGGKRQQHLLQLIEEMVPLLAHFCPELEATDCEATVIKVARATASNYSSMYQDLASGRMTEIDAITGYLLGQAQQIKRPMPTHTKLYQKLKEHSFGYQMVMQSQAQISQADD
jgi:2-dehydropantoate 2-reductase